MYFRLRKLKKRIKVCFSYRVGTVKPQNLRNIPALGGKNERKEETRSSFLQDSNLYCGVINKQKSTQLLMSLSVTFLTMSTSSPLQRGILRRWPCSTENSPGIRRMMWIWLPQTSSSPPLCPTHPETIHEKISAPPIPTGERLCGAAWIPCLFDFLIKKHHYSL